MELKMNDNKIKQPLYIVALTAVLLVALSFVKIEYLIPQINFTIRTVDVLIDIKSAPAEQPSINNLYAHPRLNLASLNFLSNFFEGEKDNLPSPAMVEFQGKKTPITGDLKQLNYFFEAVKLAKQKSIRVAHFGDSAIEGDLVTADIREILQTKMGGNGAGWLGIVSQDISFRSTTKHSFSQGNWESASLYTSNPKGLPLGISGEANIPKGNNAWVQYETTPLRRYLRDFGVVKLYYTNAKASSISYSFDGSAPQTAVLTPGGGLQELVLKPKGKARSIKITFPVVDQALVFGVSLENEPGVYVDNFPLRGNSGVDLLNLNPALLKDFAKYMDYKLIVLEFGLNIAGNKADYSWYEREMIKVVNNFKTVFPKASIILVSIHDKSTKKGADFVTDPTILRLLDSQKNIARTTNIAFWSLFDAMGGSNSMPNWVNAVPPLAFKDYIHFNDQGAKKVSQLFTDALLDEYSKAN